MHIHVLHTLHKRLIECLSLYIANVGIAAGVQERVTLNE